MQQPAADEQIDLPSLFPSLFTSLLLLRDFPYELGWLTGCVNDAAYCFIRAYVEADPTGDVTRHLATARVFATQYLEDNAFSREPSSASQVNVDELVNVVQVIHASFGPTGLPSQSSWVAINNQITQAELIGEIEASFVDLIYVAVIQHVYGGNYNHRDLYLVHSGWYDARETDDDTDKTPTQAVQYIPDDTPTEFVPYGPKVAVYQFSIPCYDALPADTKCPICCYTVQETPGEAWVLARCSGRHAYHEVHLDEWVNGAAENANTCPLDREVLCVARERVHQSALERAEETVR